MNLEDRLAETLNARAGDVAPAPGLAAAALSRGRRLRRRRRIAVVTAPAVAAVAVLIGTSVVSGGRTAAPTPLPATPPPVVGVPPAAPYVAPPQDGKPATVRLASADALMPPGTTAVRLLRAGAGAVVETETPGGDDAVYYVDPAGRLKALPGLVAPVAVNHDGSRLAARFDNGLGKKLLGQLDPATGQRFGIWPEDVTPVGFVGGPDEDQLLVSSAVPGNDGRRALWLWVGAGRVEVPDGTYDGAAVARRGNVVVTDGAELRAYHLLVDGRLGQVWDRGLSGGAPGTVISSSPQGRWTALVQDRRVVVLDVVDGREVWASPRLPAEAETVRWFDEQTFVVRVGEGKDRVDRVCDIQGGGCRDHQPFVELLPG